IRQHAIDLVHWHMCEPLANGYVWGLSLLAPTVKHLFTDHNSRIFPLPRRSRLPGRLLKRALLRRYSRVVGVSQFVVEQLQRQEGWRNLTCLHHFINTDRFRPDPAARAEVRARMGVEGCFVVASVCQLIRHKGIDVLLRAVAELPPNNVVVWVIGEGDQAEAL